MKKRSQNIIKVFLFTCLTILLGSCGQTNVNGIDTKETDTPFDDSLKKVIDLNIGEISIGNSRGEYVAWTHITNNGDTTANNYSIVIEWRCPTDTRNVHYTPMPSQAMKSIKPRQTVLISFSLPLACEPRPIIIPCVFHVINMSSIKESDTTNNKKMMDYKLTT